jgi:hypothetical protein
VISTDNVVISTGDRNSLVEVYVLDGSFETKIKSIEQLSLFEVKKYFLLCKKFIIF